MGWGFGNLGGAAFNKSILIVTAPTGSMVTCKKGKITKMATEKNGVWTFSGLDNGTWVVKATKQNLAAEEKVIIDKFNVYRISIDYLGIPKFTYTGDFSIVDDEDRPISNIENHFRNWKIRFLTSGTFKVTDFGRWDGMADVFGVAGGGASAASPTKPWGGEGGHAETKLGVKIELNKTYAIDIGTGGTPSEKYRLTANGGRTTGFSMDLPGGLQGYYGPSNHENNMNYKSPGVYEFNQETGTILYGRTVTEPGAGKDNTGEGGLNVKNTGTKGGSGIMILRNKRGG